jgi:hypothetical protein
MFSFNLGSGAVAFEIEGDADRVGSLDPSQLIERHWPAEVVENYKRYKARSMHSDAVAGSRIANTSVSDKSQPE